MRRRLYLGEVPTSSTADHGVKLRVEDENGEEILYAGGDCQDQSNGEHVGSHPASCTCSQDTSGEMTVRDKNGDPICRYEPAEFSVTQDEEGNLIHVHRLGEWSLEKNQQIEPEPAEDERYAGRARAHDLTATDTNMPRAL